jgi:hypothetical protein
MDNIRNLITGEPKEEEPPKEVGLMDKIHGALGGGPESEKNEDALDKGSFPPSLYPPGGADDHGGSYRFCSGEGARARPAG